MKRDFLLLLLPSIPECGRYFVRLSQVQLLSQNDSFILSLLEGEIIKKDLSAKLNPKAKENQLPVY